MKIAIALILAVTLAACSSSSSSTSTTDCFSGSYAVTFGAESTGTAGCPNLSSQTTTYVYTRDTQTNSYSGTEPPNTTPEPSNAFNENTCTADLAFDAANAVQGCTTKDVWTYHMAFTSTGFSGTYSFTGCGEPSLADGGTDPNPADVVSAHCVYPITGHKN